MFDRFTERARQVIVLAQEEARGLNHPAIGTEHILLGIIREKDGVGAQALAGLGFNLEKTRATIVKLRGRGPESATREQIPFSAPAKTVLEQALREALDLNHTYISTEHLLLGLLYSEETMVYKIFEARGVKPEEVRAAVMQYLTDEGTKPDKGKSQTAQKMKNLEKYGRDLTALAEDGKLDPVIGRETEVERIMQILSRRTKNNPVLLGEPGVGKTAVVEGLAQMLVKGNVPSLLEDKRIFALDLASLVAGTKYRGEFEQRLKKVMEAVTKDKDIILFIDEIHNLIGAGGAEGALDAASIVKPLLARGELQTIGATTLDEFRKYFERDAALERRFQQIKVPEPSVEDTVLILEGLRDRYEQHHSVRITDDALQAAAELADRYISDRFLPDKAIDLIDEAASRTRLKALISDPRITEIDEQLASIRRQIELAISEERFEDGADLKAKERELRRERETIELSADEALAAVIPELGEEEIAEIVSMWTGVPVFKLTEAETKKLIGMEEELHKRVIGQEVAITAVSKAIRRSRAGIKDPKRPTGSFIFLGPSGVGKTELARTLAEFLFGDEEALVRIDMSEYMESHSVSRLVGSPPGYIGHDEGGQLTEAVRRKPYSVLLLDEIEKAHPDVFNILLQILEDGRLTDSQGRTVNFRNTIIIMTSNIGAKEIARNKGMGFTVSDDELGESYDDMKKRIMSDLKRVFRPEFLNRIDEVIVFHKLSKEEIREIIDLLLVGLRQRLAEHSLQLELSDEAADFLADVGFDATMGARPLRRAIQRYIEDPLADEILAAIESFDDDERPEKQTVIVERVEDPDDDADPLEIRVVEGPLAAC